MLNQVMTALKGWMYPDTTTLDDAYLADAVDIYDLERRMRELDDRRLNPMWPSLISHGTA